MKIGLSLGVLGPSGRDLAQGEFFVFQFCDGCVRARGRPGLENGRGRGAVEEGRIEPGELGVADRCEDEQLAVLGHRYSADGQGSEIGIPLAFLGWEDGVGVIGVDR